MRTRPLESIAMLKHGILNERSDGPKPDNLKTLTIMHAKPKNSEKNSKTTSPATPRNQLLNRYTTTHPNS